MTVLSQPFLEALQHGFWPIWLASIVAAAVSVAVTRRRCIARTLVAILASYAAQTAWEGAGYLNWWQHLVIDVPMFFLITMPPRHYWQSTMGALVFAELVLHCVWGVSDASEMARIHWLGCSLLGYAKCAILLLWSGGARVEAILDRAARAASLLVLAPASRQLSG